MKKQILALLLMSLGLFAQSTVSISNPNTPPPSGYAPGATVTLNVSTDKNAPTLSGIQFNFSAPALGVSSVTAVAGPAAVAAGKSIQCSTGLTPTCIVFGFNETPITNGVIAAFTVTLGSSLPTSPIQVTLSAPIEADVNGSALAVAVVNPTLSLPVLDKCAITGDASPSPADQQVVVAAIIGKTTTPATDLNQDGATNVLDAQMVAAASINGVCTAK